jgi:DNA-binding CsgD family transcriptional regulator
MKIIAMKPRRGRASSGNAPTPAERETLRDIKLGLTNKEIASKRSVSVNTVRSQVSSLLRKSGLESRKSLAKWRDKMDDPKRPEILPACSFCRKNADQVTFLIAGPANFLNICGSCVDACNQMIARGGTR